jgi:hypothetical protein
MEGFTETHEHKDLRDSIRRALGPWHAFVVALDGVDAAGKSTLARYLAWQLGMPAVETDLFLDEAEGGLTYRLDCLRDVVQGRLSRNRPVIVEGVRVLQLLHDVGINEDFLVWVEQEDHTGSFGLQKELDEYTGKFGPRKRANTTFRWRLDTTEESGI